MDYKIYIKNDGKNKIIYITYKNGKIIELTRNDCHRILNDDKHIFLILNGTLDNQRLDKVFDINNRRFINKKIEMQILYNNYKDFLKKQSKRKILKYNPKKKN